MRDVAVDACCLINLLAAGTILPDPPASVAKGKAPRPKGRISALARTLHVPGVVASESLYLLQPDDNDDSKLIKTPIDLTRRFDVGLLVQCEVDGEAETNLFVRFATALDDGEAACMAIARNRGWTLATDDRPATNLAGQFDIPVITTAELVKEWARKSKSRRSEITRTLLNIQRFARFVPRPSSPGAKWWYAHTAK